MQYLIKDFVVEESNILYFLYLNKNHQELQINHKNLTKSGFKKDNPTVIITHGYLTPRNALAVTLIRDGK